ncbi:hypothetical protein IFM89_023660 [Coptis chinensis]|uniref:HSF-type DNA-binding domain-containing protein n=1 Tax=Coptis chinensis TaxID=261450 RepID=A0A835LSS6_9MAGN|nr:hypothetical protein IFM89_023660 [Coptis chinensis]
MEASGQGSSGGGGGGGPAPFLLKTYDMVDDISTDEIVSWSANKNSFVVWNPPEFSRLLLPTFFKHNNFSSFIRQLNTYGFRKVDPEKWEFANEEFIKDQKHLLKNIHRRKPIHSHSHPQGSEDSERAALDDEIDKLSREKTSIQTNLWRVKQQKSKAKVQLEELEHKVQEMEQRQLGMMNYLARAVHNPTFVEHLVRMGSSSLYFSAINKKRRLPKDDYVQDLAETSFIDDNNTKSVSSHVFQQNFSNKLRLELSPAVMDTDFLSRSTQSSNDDGVSPQTRTTDEDHIDTNMRTEALLLVPETLELSDTGTSFSLRKNSLLSSQVRNNNLASTGDGDGHIPCHLNLTLASSSLQVTSSQYSTTAPQLNHDNVTIAELSSFADGKEGNIRDAGTNRNITDNDPTISSSQEVPTSKKGHPAAPGRVNDVFWEQFLTERPGSSETEEASSNFRGSQYGDQEERRAGDEKSWRNINDMEQLKL